jgi:hypothetical protein
VRDREVADGVPFPTTTIASTRLAPMWPVVIIVVILVPLLVLAWIRVRQR